MVILAIGFRATSLAVRLGVSNDPYTYQDISVLSDGHRGTVSLHSIHSDRLTVCIELATISQEYSAIHKLHKKYAKSLHQYASNFH
jgi:hypothetical protein